MGEILRGGMTEPIPIGTVVIRKSTGERYVITEHQDPSMLFTEREREIIETSIHPGTLKEAYPDGVAYVLWEEGYEVSYRNRDHSVYRVRRGSLKVVDL